MPTQHLVHGHMPHSKVNAIRSLSAAIRSLFRGQPSLWKHHERSTHNEGVLALIPLRRPDAHRIGKAIEIRSGGCVYAIGTNTFGIVYTGGPSERDGTVGIVAPTGTSVIPHMATFIAALRRGGIHRDVYVCCVTPGLSDVLAKSDFEALATAEAHASRYDTPEPPWTLQILIDAFIARNDDVAQAATLGSLTIISREVNPFWFWQDGRRVPSYLMPKYV